MVHTYKLCIIHFVFIYIHNKKDEAGMRVYLSSTSTKIDDRAKRMAIGSHLYNIIY